MKKLQQISPALLQTHSAKKSMNINNSINVNFVAKSFYKVSLGAQRKCLM
jgi:hypothetical protein